MIVRACMRICAVMALREKTWAATRVYDSRNMPVDQAPSGEDEPLSISVYTDFGELTVEGRDVFGAHTNRQFIVEMRASGILQPQDGGPVQLVALETDEGLETQLDLLQRQVVRALLHDSSSSWGELWKGLVLRILRVDEHRGAEAERGTRWAARGLVFHVDMLAEPEPGFIPEALGKVLDAMTASDSADLQAKATLFRAELGAAPPAWRAGQAALGLTTDEARGIGIGPPYDTPDTEVAIASLDGIDAAGADGMVNRTEFEEATPEHEIAGLAEDAAEAPANPVP